MIAVNSIRLSEGVLLGGKAASKVSAPCRWSLHADVRVYPRLSHSQVPHAECMSRCEATLCCV